MALHERYALYRRLEALRGRPLIVYVTSQRHNVNAMMASDAVPFLLDQIDLLPSDTTEVDVLVVSKGGEPMVSWRLVTALRERAKRVSVLVPQAAFSAATLLALGADEIVMHPFGNLGPVDAIVHRRVSGPDAKESAFSTEDLAAFLEFAKADVGLTEQRELRKVFERFCTEVGAVPVGIAGRAARMSMELGERLLRLHMSGADAEERIKRITGTLTKGFLHHGYPVGRQEARALGLPVIEPEPEVERLMWSIWLDIEDEMRSRVPFEPLAELLGSTAAQQTLAAAMRGLPPGPHPPPGAPQPTPRRQPPVGAVPVPPPAAFDVLLVVIESARGASRLAHRGYIVPVLTPAQGITPHLWPTSIGWRPMPLT